jgi:beta-lactamase regulating signal transducer with metallopeptidase domain
MNTIKYRILVGIIEQVKVAAKFCLTLAFRRYPVRFPSLSFSPFPQILRSSSEITLNRSRSPPSKSLLTDCYNVTSALKTWTPSKMADHYTAHVVIFSVFALFLYFLVLFIFLYSFRNLLEKKQGDENEEEKRKTETKVSERNQRKKEIDILIFSLSFCCYCCYCGCR